MSDSLKDRLSSHSNSFEGLLSLIPARYYYDDESNNQWKRKGAAHQDERKAEAIQARQNKFDPDHGTSALDEVKRRENAARQLAEDENVHGNANGSNGSTDDGDDNEEEDDEDVVIYDDNGNVVGESKEMSVAELLRSKAIDSEKTSSNDRINNDFGSNGSAKPVSPTKKSLTKKSAAKDDLKQTKESLKQTKDGLKQTKDSLKQKESSKQKDALKSNATNASKTGNLSTSDSNGSANSENLPTTLNDKPQSRAGIEELRAKLAARVNELRAIRKAPGSQVSGAPKNREELLAARKQKLEMKKSLKKGQAAGAEASGEGDDDEDSEVDVDDDETVMSDISSIADSDSSLIFGQIQFGDGARLGRNGTMFEQQRSRKKRNAIDQLKVLENRRAKMGKLDKGKQDEIAENAKWSRAILQSEGVKVRDDEKMLKRTIKKQENRKKRSEKEWKQRLYNVKKGISDRESKRNTNIRAHKEAKKLRLKGKKRREHMKKAGAS